MYAVSKDSREIDGIEVTTWNRVIENGNVLGVEVGTNGYWGGDSDQGSRSYVRIENLSGTDLRARTLLDRDGSCGVEIILGGDSALDSFIEAVEFVLKTLKDGVEEGSK